jgi:hypothetical protein
MAFRFSNIFFVAPHATVLIAFEYGRGEDHGTQWATAHPLPGEPPRTWLATEKAGKILTCESSVAIAGEGARCLDPVPLYQYWVGITNEASVGCRFQLEGGGLG